MRSFVLAIAIASICLIVNAAAPAHIDVPVTPTTGEAARPLLDGHPITSVVVTQCNLIVAVYITMADGRLLRFDHTAALPANELMSMAYSAERSERVEVGCNEGDASQYERRDPI